MTDEHEQTEKGSGDVWIYVQHREGDIEPETYGLIAEARRMHSEMEGRGSITAVALGAHEGPLYGSLSHCGADRVLCLFDDSLKHYNGELFSLGLHRLIEKYSPSYFLMTQHSINADLSSRVAAMAETALVTRVVDFKIDREGRPVVTRPINNGYLFERRLIRTDKCPIICYMPSVLSESGPDVLHKAKIIEETMEIPLEDLKIKIKDVIAAAPDELDIQEADIIVAGGRGVGNGDAFNIIHELARIFGGSVGGTRPIIDWQLLPFERQIGQTGKTIKPHLLITCGISGANEFTAGMENSRLVIAVNKDPNARIFKFADLGIIGDVHEVIPRLIEGIKKTKNHIEHKG